MCEILIQIVAFLSHFFIYFFFLPKAQGKKYSYASDMSVSCISRYALHSLEYAMRTDGNNYLNISLFLIIH
jgi:hypothetical protein